MASNREIEKLFDQWNPNNIRVGDIVQVKVSSSPYRARIVGIDLDLKNKKVYANLRLMDATLKNPIKVDVADCYKIASPLYRGHHTGG